MWLLVLFWWPSLSPGCPTIRILTLFEPSPALLLPPSFWSYPNRDNVISCFFSIISVICCFNFSSATKGSLYCCSSSATFWSRFLSDYFLNIVKCALGRFKWWEIFFPNFVTFSLKNKNDLVSRLMQLCETMLVVSKLYHYSPVFPML